MNATLVQNEIPVRHTIREDVNREFLTFSVPNGWDDVKPLANKVLQFDGKKFVFSGWNSDRNECCFFRMLNNNPATAKLI